MYRREENFEVDFILEGDKIIGFEVKSGVKADNAGMNVFAAKFHPEKILILGTAGIPYSDFLKVNHKELF